MKRFLHAALLSGVFFFTTLNASSEFILEGSHLLNDKVREKVSTLAQELHEKTGIGVYLSLPATLNEKPLVVYEKERFSALHSPFAVLSLAMNEKKIDIFSAPELEEYFDKEAILSPYPWEGSILPILTSKKKNDNLNAAVLNGFADLVEQIASNKGIVLDNAIGSTNRNMLNILRMIFYGSIILVVLVFLWRKVKRTVWKS